MSEKNKFLQHKFEEIELEKNYFIRQLDDRKSLINELNAMIENNENDYKCLEKKHEKLSSLYITLLEKNKADSELLETLEQIEQAKNLLQSNNETMQKLLQETSKIFGQLVIYLIAISKLIFIFFSKLSKLTNKVLSSLK